ncbi:MAG: hypothetical protein HY403_04695 [Elusimicrobia bacterium]|nr:hypothetical protein [Elusimicrobiota bacterium]
MKTKPAPRCLQPRARSTVRLLDIVGLERFLTLRDEFGGRSLWIPKRGGIWPCGLCRIRDRCIIRWHGQGHSPAVISAALKIKPATVGRVISAARRRVPRAARTHGKKALSMAVALRRVR